MISIREYQSFRGRLAALTSILVLLALAPRAVVQAQHRPPEGAFVDRLEVHWVLIPVTVREQGGPVESLDVTELDLEVDGTRVPVATLGSNDEPATLVWLQDLSGSMATLDRLALARQTLACVAAEIGLDDEILLASFSDHGVGVEVPRDAPRPALATAADRWEARGETALVDALAWLPELSLDAASRRLAIVVTDGRDNASRQSPERVQAQALDLHLPLYVIDLSAVGLAPHLPAPEGETGRWLRDLADRTGGRVFRPRDPRQALEACHSTATDLESQYVVGFVADATVDPQVHRLRVSVADPDRDVSHRPSYLGPPPSSPTPTTPNEEDRP